MPKSRHSEGPFDPKGFISAQLLFTNLMDNDDNGERLATTVSRLLFVFCRSAGFAGFPARPQK